MFIVLGILFFIFGTIIGSFLNVVILRMGTGRGFGGRSACGSCRKKLSWYELIPLVSFLIQYGRCRACKIRLSRQYPLVEFVAGLLSLGVYAMFSYLLLLAPFSFTVWYVGMFSLWAVFLVIAVYDIRHTIIPDRLLVIGLALVITLQTVQYYPNVLWALVLYISSGLVLALPFGLIFFFSRGKYIGFGDVKLTGLIGMMLGLWGGITAIMAGIYLGAIVSIFLLVVKGKKYTLKTEIPFGPFLIIGTALVFFSAGTIVDLTLLFMSLFK